ncbi:type II toxin-antitoxin system PemK/MazF family toxin [Nocardia sp. NPDC003693]
MWAFTVSIGGRAAPSSLGPDLVLIVSNSADNAVLPHVAVLPVSSAPATDLTVLLEPGNPRAGMTVDVTRGRTMPKRWLAHYEGTLTRKKIREVFAAEVQYRCPDPE